MAGRCAYGERSVDLVGPPRPAEPSCERRPIMAKKSKKDKKKGKKNKKK